MAVMKMNFGNVSMIRNERTYRQKQAYITAHNNTFYCMRIKNELKKVLDFNICSCNSFTVERQKNLRTVS